jgi:putative sigma-54 modulation protein
MDIRIKNIHFDVTEKLEAFIEKKVSKLEKFCNATAVEVTLKIVKPETSMNKQVGLKVAVPNGDLYAEKVKNTFEEALLETIEAIERQIEKRKEKQG